MTQKEKLQKDIEDAKKKLAKLEELEKTGKRNSVIKKLEDYTDKEKINFFNKMYNRAERELKELEDNGYSDEDNSEYAWEEYISILAKDNNKFWEYWRSLS